MNIQYICSKASFEAVMTKMLDQEDTQCRVCFFLREQSSGKFHIIKRTCN